MGQERVTSEHLEPQQLRNFEVANNMDPGTNPPRYQRQSTNYTGWILGALAALAVIGAIAYGMRDHGSTDAGQTTGNSAPQTTGQSSPAQNSPSPSNPAQSSPPAGAPATNR
jgi:hypothetical protein